MGWTYTNRKPGVSHLAWFRREFSPLEIVDLTSVGMTLYGAVRTKEHGTVGLVILTRRVPNDYYNFGYKEIDESMGPGETDCPERIFDLLDGEPINEWARNWREECRKNIERRKARPRLTKGTKVRFPVPLRFTDGTEADTFEFVKRNTFRRIMPLDFTPQVGEPWYYGGLVSISGWSKREYELVA